MSQYLSKFTGYGLQKIIRNTHGVLPTSTTLTQQNIGQPLVGNGYGGVSVNKLGTSGISSATGDSNVSNGKIIVADGNGGTKWEDPNDLNIRVAEDVLTTIKTKNISDIFVMNGDVATTVVQKALEAPMYQHQINLSGQNVTACSFIVYSSSSTPFSTMAQVCKHAGFGLPVSTSASYLGMITACSYTYNQQMVPPESWKLTIGYISSNSDHEWQTQEFVQRLESYYTVTDTVIEV